MFASQVDPAMPSSVIRFFDYRAADRALDVGFVSGRVYRYLDVPPELAADFRAAFAKGAFFNARIRDRFACRELKDRRGERG
jgi:hypothetical protein